MSCKINDMKLIFWEWTKRTSGKRGEKREDKSLRVNMLNIQYVQKFKKKAIYKNMHSLEKLKCWLYYPLRMDGLDEKCLSIGLLFNNCETSDQARYGSNNSSHFIGRSKY